MRRMLLPVAVIVVAVGCQDATQPIGPAAALPGLTLSETGETEQWSDAVMILRQSPTAPPLMTYTVGFMARRGEATAVEVRYVPLPGELQGPLFMRFELPDRALLGDKAVPITLTIDPVKIAVSFQPSGLQFSKANSPTLTLCYGNADPDLNGDGVVDEVDQALESRLAVWYQPSGGSRWLKTASSRNTEAKCIASPVQHFSTYAVSW